MLLTDDDGDFCSGIERAFKRLAPGLGVFPFYYGDDALAPLGLRGTDRPVPGLVILDRRVRARAPTTWTRASALPRCSEGQPLFAGARG